ncbi:ATPase subunit of ABC transporter with duplicated ATPase domains [Pseudomonas sp. LP_7_YM]|nr:ATP-binding cassette domain-containing protein [Pseudomonas sp. LP_7_YM]TDV67657.1 ATPase subunit of ABC transporter with duplicated ATPase domains [Pseudomonas sp. LP_7_YM]
MTIASLTLQSVSLALPDGRQVFSDLTAQFDQQPTGLVGRNGVGKSLLARLLAGQLEPSGGRCLRTGSVHYLAQQVDLPPDLTVAGLAGLAPVIDALQRIEAGSVDPADFDAVGERWDICQRLQTLLQAHGLGQLALDRPATELSGGEAMRVALLGAWLAEPDLLILDEPTHPLDGPSREALMEQLRLWPKGLLVISHDRALLQQMSRVVELSSRGLQSYGGNFAFYEQCKVQERVDAERLVEQRKHQRKQGERALAQQRERQERRQAQGNRQAREANQAPIQLGRQKARSEQSAGKLHLRQSVVLEAFSQQVRDAVQRVEQDADITLYPPLNASSHRHRVAELKALRLPYGGPSTALDLTIGGRQRIGLVGANGAGKSTLLQVLAGRLSPLTGLCSVQAQTAFLDQRLGDLDPNQSVLEQLLKVNRTVSEGELRTRLAHLGLDAHRLTQPCVALSGGERLKAALACALYADRPAQLLLLDEPGNHLDLVRCGRLRPCCCNTQERWWWCPMMPAFLIVWC